MLAVLLGVSAVLHVVAAVRGWPSIVAVVAVVLAVAAAAVAFLVPVRTRQADLVAAIVVGALGVLAFLLPTILALADGTAPGTVLDLWSVGGFLVDTVVVRLAGITLRREARAGSAPG